MGNIESSNNSNINKKESYNNSNNNSNNNNDKEDNQKDVNENRYKIVPGKFIIQFLKASDIPLPNQIATSNITPYIKSYISVDITKLEDDQRCFLPVSKIMKTQKRTGCTTSNATFNCYRDFQITPPKGSYLSIELYDSSYWVNSAIISTSVRSDNNHSNESNGSYISSKNTFDQENPIRSNLTCGEDIVDNDPLIGTIHIPVDQLVDGNIKTYKFEFKKFCKRKGHPNFSLTLKRCFLDKNPVLYKTIYILRHGESKWNEAQTNRNLIGLVDFDHTLTHVGIDQAHRFNMCWTDYYKHMISSHGKNWSENSLLSIEMKNIILTSITNLHHSNITQKVEQKKSTIDIINTQPNNNNSLNQRKSTTSIFSNNSLKIDDISVLTLPNEINDFSIVDFDGESNHNTLNNITVELRYAWREELRRLFFLSSKIFSSPLTRAIQTAFVCMENHPIILSSGMTLYSGIREFKGVGGLDSVGIAYGDGIFPRVKLELEKVIGKERTNKICNSCNNKKNENIKDINLIHSSLPALDLNDADLPWWTSVSSYDSKQDQEERVKEFVNFTRYCEEDYPIFVGHSLFFKHFYSNRVSSFLEKNRPNLASKMKQLRLSNATILAVILKYSDNPDDGGCSEATVIDADLIFGGGFHGGSDEHY